MAINPAVPVMALNPVREMTPGAVGAIRNQIIEALVKQVVRELSLTEDKLVVRDVRPFNDLQLYAGGTTNLTTDVWGFDVTTTTVGTFTTISGAKTMGDQRYVAIYGVRDLHYGVGIHSTAMGTDLTSLFGVAGLIGNVVWPQIVAQIKISVGGADKVIWDLSGMYAYPNDLVGFSSAAVVIPQNAAFNVYYMLRGHLTNTTLAPGARAMIQLVGVTVEPRGKVISP